MTDQALGQRGGGSGKLALIFLLGVVGTILVIYASAALIVAVAVFMLGRMFLSRGQWVVLALASLVGVVLTAGKTFASYSLWLPRMVGQGDTVESWWHVQTTLGWVPPVSVFLLGLFLASLYAAVWGSGFASVNPLALSSGMSKSKQLSGGEDIIPEKRSKVRKRLIKRPAPLDRIPKPGSKGRSNVPGKRKFPLGRDSHGKLVMLTEGEIKTHGVLLGSTGSGKTETIKWMAGALLDMGLDGCIVDLKEDTEPGGLRDFCRAYSYVHGTQYQEVALSDDHGMWWFNALAGMTPDEAFNALMTLNDFDDQYHQSMNRKAGAQALQLMFHAHRIDSGKFPYPTMFALGRMLEENVFKAAKPMLATVMQEEGADRVRELYGTLQHEDQTLMKEAQSFGLRLTNLYDSQAGRNVLLPGRNPDGVERAPIDVTKPGLTYIGLSSLGQPDMARTVSSATLQRFNAFAAQLSQGKIKKGNDRFIIVDEANFINRELVMNMLSRARSAGLRVFLATQGPEDWIDEHGDYWGRISQNTNVTMIMKQTSPKSAELTAEFIGKGKQASVTQVIREGELVDHGTVSTRSDLQVDPEDLRKFEEGEMILRTPSRISWLQVPMRTPELAEYKEAGYPAPPPPL